LAARVLIISGRGDSKAIANEKRCWICYIEYEEFGKRMSCTFTAIVYWEEDVYVAECPEVGTASQGETIEEAIANLKEATELYLEEFPLPKTSPVC
jgi:predicted RNase H-like HicB family nuclease